MISMYSKWINILSILLALLSMGQLMFSLTMLFLSHIILSKAGAYMSTICGVISSLICLPVAFKIRTYTSQLRVHHFDIQTYLRFVLYLCLGFQAILILISCSSLAQGDAVESALKKALIRYNRLASDKKFIDVVQILFQCCGVFSYQDWAYRNWIHLNKPLVECSGTCAIVNNLNENCPSARFSTSNNEEVQYLSAVPYSCCVLNTSGPCRNYDLKCSGLSTINMCGCLPQIFTFILSLIFSEIVLSVFIGIVIIFLIKILHKEEIYKMDSETEKEKWDKFTNSYEVLPDKKKDSSHILKETKSAELVPSTQQQLIINKDDKTHELLSTSSKHKKNKMKKCSDKSCTTCKAKSDTSHSKTVSGDVNTVTPIMDSSVPGGKSMSTTVVFPNSNDSNKHFTSKQTVISRTNSIESESLIETQKLNSNYNNFYSSSSSEEKVKSKMKKNTY